jgi:hypothetical protein
MTYDRGGFRDNYLPNFSPGSCLYRICVELEHGQDDLMPNENPAPTMSAGFFGRTDENDFG